LNPIRNNYKSRNNMKYRIKSTKNSTKCNRLKINMKLILKLK